MTPLKIETYWVPGIPLPPGYGQDYTGKRPKSRHVNVKKGERTNRRLIEIVKAHGAAGITCADLSHMVNASHNYVTKLIKKLYLDGTVDIAGTSPKGNTMYRITETLEVVAEVVSYEI